MHAVLGSGVAVPPQRRELAALMGDRLLVAAGVFLLPARSGRQGDPQVMLQLAVCGSLDLPAWARSRRCAPLNPKTLKPETPKPLNP